jgi:predicted transcriptional regulator
MSQVKEEAIKLIQSLPDDCTVEDIQYHLYVREKVMRGLAAVDEGRVVPQAEAERRIAEWGRSFGPTQPSTMSKRS